MTPGAFISFDVQNLDTIRVYDESVMSGSETINQINAVRFMFTTVNVQASLEEDVTTCEAWKEYEVTSGTAVANGTSYTTGQTMYFSEDTTPTGTWTADETGYYGGYNTFLPNTSPFYAEFTPSQTGYSEDDTVFSDQVFTMRYEIYTTQHAAGAITVPSSTTYIVKGTAGDYITISGQTFYVGEVFTKATNFTFANGSGTNYIVELEGTAYVYFRTWADNFSVLNDYYSNLAQNSCGCSDEALMANFVKVFAMVNTPAVAAARSINVSLDNIQNLLNEVNDYWGVKQKCC